MSKPFTMETTCRHANDGEGMDVRIVFNYQPPTPDYYDKRLGAYLPGDTEAFELVSVQAVNGLLLDEFMQPALDDWATDWLAGDGQDDAREAVMASAS